MTTRDTTRGPFNPPASGLPDIVSDAYAGLTPEQKAARKALEDDRFRTLMTEKDAAAQSLAAFLVMIFAGIEKDKKPKGDKPVKPEEPSGLNEPKTLAAIAAALGLEFSDLSKTVADVRTGKVDYYVAAQETAARVDPAKTDWSKAASVKMADLVRRDGPTLLNPELLKRMQTDERVRQMVQWTFEAAEKNGIDGKLLANQFWQESGFNPQAKSGVGAMGVAQFMPATGAAYGLKGDDFWDPKKSIEAGARHMGDMTRKYGSQQLALIAYNAGGKAIDSVERRLGRDASVADWMAVMQEDRQKLGIRNAKGEIQYNLWRVQTFEYVQKIDPAYWPPEKRQLAEARQNSVLQQMFAMGGSNEAQKKPNLTPTFTDTLATGGRIGSSTLALAGLSPKPEALTSPKV